MNQANISVCIKNNLKSTSIDGRNHLLGSCDYGIGQFKHLKNLLLFHGRESYRKNAYVTYFIIYKNFLFLVPTIIYALYSGFQGINIYGDWTMQLFNILFTALPVLIFGVIDLEYDKEVLLHNPQIYKEGITNELFTKKIFWKWLMYAVI